MNWKPSLVAAHKPALAQPVNRPGPAEAFLDVGLGFVRIPVLLLSVKIDIGIMALIPSSSFGR